MAPLERARQKIILVLVVLGVINLALATYLLWPGRPDVIQQRIEREPLFLVEEFDETFCL